ncbi:MAG: hypothetical protein IAF00_06770 [Phycisphaerales bacterium]|nr:hypothetical protein [Phycisphaerales bacterium]
MSRIHKKLWPMLLFGLSLMPFPLAWAGDIILMVEEPRSSETYSGVANLRGWAVSSVGIDRIELYVDGILHSSIPTGGQRTDVGDTYPSYPDSATSGFSMAFNYSGLLFGAHSMLIRAVDTGGATQDAEVSFYVTRFANSYISDPTKISLSNASTTIDTARSFLLKNVVVDGKNYNLRLEWRTEAQDFAITRITQTSDSSTDNYSGTYRSQATLTSNSCPFSVSQQVSSLLTLTQDGTALSGTENSGGTLTVTGTLDSQGGFVLRSERLVQSQSANCRGEAYYVYQGSFPNQTVTITTYREYFGSCPYYNCSSAYQGSTVKN